MTSDLKSQAAGLLRETYGHDKAAVTAAAPGRVNLIGEHIDYCDGFVLPLAIERSIVIAAAPNGTKAARVTSMGERCEIPLDAPQEIAGPKWSNYLRGVFHGFLERHDRIPGFDAAIVSDIPLGAGLSSSAALELAAATLVEGLCDTRLDTREKALLCQKAEHDFAGVPCGIMDQFASAFGRENHLVLIDCRSQEPELVPFSDPSLSLVVANTKVSHDLSEGAYADRRAATERALAVLGKASWRDVTMDDLLLHEKTMDPTDYRRARHVIGEIQRTREAADEFKAGDYSRIGAHMAASHRSLRDDFEVSCPELDLMVGIAEDIGFDGGVLGARMTGGGFGGSTITLCRTSDAEAIERTLRETYQKETGIASDIFTTRPGPGARLL